MFYSEENERNKKLKNLSQNCKFQILHCYVPISSHTDNEIYPFYDNMNEMNFKETAIYISFIGDFNAKLGKKEQKRLKM